MSSGDWTITDIERFQSEIGIRQLEIQKWGGEFTGAGGKQIFFYSNPLFPKMSIYRVSCFTGVHI